MAKRELIIRPENQLTVLNEDNKLIKVSELKYQLVDASHYMFETIFNDDVVLRIQESDHDYKQTEFVDSEFVDEEDISNSIYYWIAASSGLLTGILSAIRISEKDLEEIKKWKKDIFEKYVVDAAMLAGYKKNDYRGAVDFLMKTAVSISNKYIETNGISKVVNERVQELSSHPSLAGFLFSLATQFKGEIYKFDKNKHIVSKKPPKYYAIGRTSSEKIIYGILYWVFYLSMDKMISQRMILEDMGLPKNLLKVIKDVCNLPFMKSIPTNYEEAERAYSNWIIKLFEETEKTEDEEQGENAKLDIHELVKNILKREINDAPYILLNECITRSFYSLYNFCSIIKKEGIASLDQMSDKEIKELFPSNNRIVSRMSVISSGVFATISVSGAAIRALKNKNTEKRKFAEAFLAEISFAGIGRFIIALANDVQYWGDDIDIRFRRSADSINKEKETSEKEKYEDFTIFSLTPEQGRALYSLEALKVNYDIERTKKKQDRETKKEWLREWKYCIAQDKAVEYFVDDEQLIYDALYKYAHSEENWIWFYLATMELAMFEPYRAIGSENDKKFQKLNLDSDYVKEQFIRKQTVVSQDEMNTIIKQYSKYKGIVSGKTKKLVLGAGATAVLIVATGGLALTFAPQIAIAFAGEAVVGLHGVALTNASLALVGGGSIAAGGLGMAGGTAIITGGGALIGLTGSGGISVVAAMSNVPSEYWTRQGTKLLTFCAMVHSKGLVDSKKILAVAELINDRIGAIDYYIESVDQEKNDLDKDSLAKAKEFKKCLEICKDELAKIAKH